MQTVQAWETEKEPTPERKKKNVFLFMEVRMVVYL